jgi:hypothetical protein
LYIYNNTLDMLKNFVPAFPGRYLSSNVNITYTNDDGTTVDTPVGSRFAKFNTEQCVLISLKIFCSTIISFTVAERSLPLAFCSTLLAMTMARRCKRLKTWSRNNGFVPSFYQ